MTDVGQLSVQEEHFILQFLLGCGAGRAADDPFVDRPLGDEELRARLEDDWRPFVTLTYACSLDGMISLGAGLRTTLSGPESKSMTHFLRLHHDAILVGAGTAIADDPSLNCRYPGVTKVSQPRPVVIDPGMRWDVTASKVGALAAEERGKRPLVIHKTAPHDADASYLVHSAISDRLFIVCDDGTPLSESRHINWIKILRELKKSNVDSVMIEGGAWVISNLLTQPDLVDAVIVTIAPTWLGQDGVAASPAPKVRDGLPVNPATLQDTTWRQFGKDAVLCGRLM